MSSREALMRCPCQGARSPCLNSATLQPQPHCHLFAISFYVVQAVVDAVVVLLESGAFSPAGTTAGTEASAPGAAAGSTQPTTAATAATATAEAETAALQFLAAHLASNRAVASGGVLLRVLRHLAAAAPGPAPAPAPTSARASSTATGMAAAHPTITGTSPGADMSLAEREAVFCDVVSAAGASMSPPDQQQVSREVQCGARWRREGGAGGVASSVAFVQLWRQGLDMVHACTPSPLEGPPTLPAFPSALPRRLLVLP